MGETRDEAVDPSKVDLNGLPCTSDEPAAPMPFTKNSIPDLVLLCGSPGAGNPPFSFTFSGNCAAASCQRGPQGRIDLMDQMWKLNFMSTGKSTFYWNHLRPLGYERVNQDQLKTVRRFAACV